MLELYGKCGQGGRDQGGAGAGEGLHEHPASPKPDQVVNSAPRALQRRRDVLGVPRQDVAGLGQRAGATGAQEQGRTQRTLQPLHVLADRWLCPAQFDGCRGHTAGPGNVTEDHYAGDADKDSEADLGEGVVKSSLRERVGAATLVT